MNSATSKTGIGIPNIDRRSNSSPIIVGENLRKLPRHIAITVIGTILFSFIVFTASVVWMIKTLDQQALENSFIQMRSARLNLLAKSRTVTLDYTNWDAAVSAMRTADEFWLYDNVGSAALIGQAVQLADMWGGALPSPAGWITGDGREPRVDALTSEMRHLVEDRLSDLQTTRMNSNVFFDWRGGDVFAFGAAPFAPVYGAVPARPGQRSDGWLVMGIRLTDPVMSRIAENYFLKGITIVAQEPTVKPFIPLFGIDGNPVAFLAWDPPHPGVDLLKQMTPILAAALIFSAALMAFGVKLAQKSARQLIQSERRASKAARTDFLTGLPNRAAFTDAIEGTAAAGQRAIMFLDLNGFKAINDSAGHAAGDQIIVALGNRLACLANSVRFLAHISGDEFVFLIEDTDAPSEMSLLIQDVLRIFEEPFVAMGRQIRLDAAIGYAVQSTDELSGDDLMRQADLAMYEAKKAKYRDPVAFCPQIEDVSHDTFLIEQALRATLLIPEDLSVAYQPIARMNGQFERAEALARWTPDHLGSVSPDRFIPVAERAGIIEELGRLIFRRVCQDLVTYPDLLVNINISSIQLLSPRFLEHLKSDIAEYGILENRIQLELTESILLLDTDQVEIIFTEIISMGFLIALDDFGTGYSSIAYLDRLKFNTLKLDRAFASEIHSSQKRRALIDSVIQMAHKLNLEVVCEGVETAEDHKLLRELKCDFIQGFHVDAPLPIRDLADKWLSSPERATA